MTKHRPSDFGTMQAGVLRARNVEPTRLAEYWNRKYINDRQYDGGNALYKDWYYAGCSQTLISSYERHIPGENGSDVRVMSELRFRRALKGIGDDLSSIAVHVCLFDGTAKDWAVSQGQPQNDGIAILRLSLNRLADFYQKQLEFGSS